MKNKFIGVGLMVLGLAASIGLGWLATRRLDWGTVFDTFEGTSPSLLILAVIVFMFASYLRAFRWQILFFNESISTLRLFIVQNEGIGLNNVLPVRIGGEPTQLAVLTLRDGVKGSTAVATLGMERVLDVVASTAILAGAFFLVPEMKNFTMYVWGAVGFTVVILVLVRLVAWGSEAVSFVRRISFLAAFTSAVKDLEQRRARLAASLMLSIAYWMLVGITAWTIAMAINIPISPITAILVIMGTIFFATAVPAAPSAIGTYEFAVVYMLGFFGMEREAGFGFAVITHAVFFLPPTIIAAIFLPREAIGSIRKLRRPAAEGAGADDASGS